VDLAEAFIIIAVGPKEDPHQGHECCNVHLELPEVIGWALCVTFEEAKEVFQSTCLLGG
jgi:hypothetical protein